MLDTFAKALSFILVIILGYFLKRIGKLHPNDFAILSRMFGIGTVVSNVIAWFLSVLFAYVTNRRWVFLSTGGNVFREMLVFFSGRLCTGVLDTLVMFITVDLLGWNDLMMKILSNIIVIILNYIISKFFVFKGEDGKVVAEE